VTEPAAAPDAAWRAIDDGGVAMLRIPTPFQVGRVNCFLIEDDPLTLVDTGPNSGKALDELEHQLGSLGRRLEDIELILITHQHLDHFGLLSIVAERSGAEVAAVDTLAGYLENFKEEAELDDTFAAELMLMHGISEEVVTALRQVSASFRAWGTSAQVTRRLSDGDVVALRDRELHVGLRPGHSPTDTTFWDSERKLLVAGDHLIGHISSNPVLTRSLDGSSERPQALADYLRSMQLTRELPADVVLPGHGEPVTGHSELIVKRFAMHQRRAEKLYALIAAEPSGGHELALALWRDVAVTQAFLTLSEVIGHVDLLMNAGFVVAEEDDGQVRFRATGDADASELGDLIPGGNPARKEG
jgi:glyoxylase-like metal-dependent hydrolase (beta-lactamase superfamily II)